MSHNYDPTKNDIRSLVASFVQENSQGVVLDTGMTDNEIEREIERYLESQGEPNTEVIYNLEAFNIVMGSEFDDYGSGEIDMSSYDTPMDAMMAQANDIILEASTSFINEEVAELVEAVTAIRDHFHYTLDNSEDEHKIVINLGSVYGWAPHRYEEDGICVWTNLECEGIHALEMQVGSVSVSMCYSPNK